jgi:hypothetical protein
MPTRSLRIAALSLLLGSGGALADTLSDFNAAVERAASHQRVAIAYLRTGNVDLAALEIDRLRQAWAAVTSLKRPAALNHDPQLYTTTMVDVSTRLVGVSIMMDSGRPEQARQGLQAIRARLTALRRANGVEVLADCIAEANATMDRLMGFNDAAFDWSKAGVVAQLAAAYRGQIDRCDAMADPALRIAPEFRRLVDGLRNSLSQFPKAIAEKDTDLLRRLLVEMRSFDNLLAFRYG